jgi:hypothetical protein
MTGVQQEWLLQPKVSSFNKSSIERGSDGKSASERSKSFFQAVPGSEKEASVGGKPVRLILAPVCFTLTSADDGEAVRRLLPQQNVSRAEAYEALKEKMPEHARKREISSNVRRAKTTFEIT